MNEVSNQLDENIIGKLIYLPKSMKMNVLENKGSVLVNTGISSDMFNVACLINGNADLKSISDSFHNLPFAWWVGFGNDCEKYNQRVKELGVKNPEIEMGMYAYISKIPEVPSCETLKISQVTDLVSLSDFIRVYKKLIPADGKAIERFYLSAAPFILEKQSPLKLFVGYVDHQPVATGALFLHADVAGVWDVTTLSDFRNQGIATNIVRHILFYAYDVHNYRIGVLTATKSGEKVYRKIGFQKIKEFFIFNVSNR